MKRIFLALVGGLVAYELYTLSNDRDGDTISEIMWEATTRRPLLPFAMGVLMGHFFWQQSVSKPPAPAPGALESELALLRARAGVDLPFSTL